MPYLIMQDGLYVTCSKPLRLSKKESSAKQWNNDALAHKAIRVMGEQGTDTTGMVVRSVSGTEKTPKISVGEVSENYVAPTTSVLFDNTDQKVSDILSEVFVKKDNLSELMTEEVEHCTVPEPEVHIPEPEIVEEVKETPKAFEIIEDDDLTPVDVQAAFSGINSKCLLCAKDCKQKFSEKIVHCPLFKEKTNG